MRRATATLVMALSLLGCGSKAPPGEPVQLLTGAAPFDADECTPRAVVARLLADPQHGVALAVFAIYGGGDSTQMPVMWPPGFTGRQVGSEVVVVDLDGDAVATTGQSYLLSGNTLIQDPNRSWPNREDKRYRRGWVNSLIGPDMFYACGVEGPMAPPTPLPVI